MRDSLADNKKAGEVEGIVTSATPADISYLFPAFFESEAKTFTFPFTSLSGVKKGEGTLKRRMDTAEVGPATTQRAVDVTTEAGASPSTSGSMITLLEGGWRLLGVIDVVSDDKGSVDEGVEVRRSVYEMKDSRFELASILGE